jgi:hypothetical protein
VSVWSLKDGSLVRHTHALEVSYLSGAVYYFACFSCRCLCVWMRFRSDVGADS